ncbi:hypothetical protein TNIN_293011 [Trichonephila inaurata madagascariensis]|uniref:Uncharacterized protein n=1 Tax=Trichonephila inaurata madagascariensis TaxID=2747483 RepID=A0A8X6X5K3_9ARAC|nr:hypothetical protein TNIN_120741 [Trichonephila inaurata madagascariensis]GFY69908.1 hypothetical protein TNIN_293011 [Trichonephila inaurata madagascariensis]
MAHFSFYSVTTNYRFEFSSINLKRYFDLRCIKRGADMIWWKLSLSSITTEITPLLFAIMVLPEVRHDLEQKFRVDNLVLHNWID